MAGLLTSQSELTGDVCVSGDMRDPLPKGSWPAFKNVWVGADREPAPTGSAQGMLGSSTAGASRVPTSARGSHVKRSRRVESDLSPSDASLPLRFIVLLTRVRSGNELPILCKYLVCIRTAGVQKQHKFLYNSNIQHVCHLESSVHR